MYTFMQLITKSEHAHNILECDTRLITNRKAIFESMEKGATHRLDTL